MKKSMILMCASLFLISILTAGCGKDSTKVSLKDGTDALLATAQELKKAAAAGDEAKIKELGPQLEEKWSVYEDGVKEKYPDLYEEIEQYLDPTIAGTEATPIKADVVQQLNDQLIEAVTKLADQLK